MQKDASDPQDMAERRKLVESFYRDHSRELWALFYSQCSDPDRAYDALQESILRFLDYRGEPVRDLRAWLLRVGQNWLRDVARKKVNSCRLLPAMDDLAAGADLPVTALLTSEQSMTVRTALSTMNEDDRKVLVMKYALDWSTAKIAAAMNANAAAIDMRLSRARRRLAEILLEQGYQND